MKKWMLVMLVGILSACGSNPPVPDEEVPVASTEDVVEEAPVEAPAADIPSADTPGMAESNPTALAPDDVAAPPAGATRTVTGLSFVVLRSPKPGAQQATRESTVTAHYSGWTTDGKMFDSSVTRGEPITFPLNRVIAGWTEGVGSMSEGEIRRLWIPESLAYKGMAGKPAGMLVFDVELVKIE